MKHMDEICYWANHPDGTNVWWRYKGGDAWRSTPTPNWVAGKEYIVDNEWAELRKAQVDGKQLQFLVDEEEWKDKTLDYKAMKITLPEDWRIKSEEIYEWQWIIQIQNDKYILTDYYIDEDELIESYSGTYKIIDRYEPSKRLRGSGKGWMIVLNVKK